MSMTLLPHDRVAVRHPLCRTLVWGLALFFAWALVSPATAAETSLTMISDSGDYIGGGQQQFYTLSDGVFGASWNGGSHVSLNFHTPSYSHWWYLDFAAPSGQALAVGSYYGATRYPFQAADVPGLDVSGDGRGCNTLTGSFEVKQVVYGPGNSVVSFWAVFEQHCEGAVPALRGNIRYNADVQVAVTAPLEKTVEKGASLSFDISATDASSRQVSLSVSGAPAGAGFTDNGDNTGTFTWTPGFNQAGVYALVFHGQNDLGDSDDSTTRITVTGITSLLLDSEPGDYIGASQLLFLTPEDGNFSASRNYDNGVSLSFYSNSHYWYLDFSAPFDAMLSVGTYEGAVRWPFQDPDQPGLSVSGDGRGCNTLVGRFEVKQVVYGSGNRIDAFWATFEQHCEGGTAALRGEIRFKADVPLLVRAPSSVGGVETQNLTFGVTALAADGVHISLSATGLPAGATFTDNGDNSGTFDWIPTRGQAGSYAITFLGEDGQGMSDRGFTRIRVALLNDDFDNATVIASLPFSDQFDPALATVAEDDPSCYLRDPSVWYQMTPPHDETIELSASSNYTPGLSVYTGAKGALTQVACTGGNRLTFSVLGGQTYFIMVTAPPYGGPVTVSVDALPPPPLNDDVGNATQIATLSFEDVLDTRTATSAGTDPFCLGRGATVWYRLTPSQDIFIDANTFGSDYATTLSVYTGSPGALTQIQCGFNHVAFSALAGETYYFMVGSYFDGPGGHLVFSVVGLPPFTLDVTIAPVGRVNNRTGVAYIGGKITCSRPSMAHVSGQLLQRIGRAIVSSTFDIETPCDAQTGWSVVLRSDTGLFTAGEADAHVSASAYDSRTGEYAQDEASASIRLKGGKCCPWAIS